MSAVIRYTSDPHFHHKSMADRRGFQDEYYMNEHIIMQWNKVVKKHDTTWILGDITMEKNDYEILNRLNGIKRVVLGNHDSGTHAKTLIHYVNSIHGMVKIRDKIHGNIWLTHCPVHPKEFDHRINYNLHGHIHGYDINDPRYIKLCMENHNYTPKTLEELIK